MSVDDDKRRQELYDAHLKQTWQDIQSSTDDYDRNLLTVSSAVLGLSVGFIKDIVHFPTAVWHLVLYASWVCLAACIVVNVLSFRLSVIALKKHLGYLYEYYIKKNDEYLTKKSAAEKALEWSTWTAGVCFFAGIICTVVFCIKNLH